MAGQMSEAYVTCSVFGTPSGACFGVDVTETSLDAPVGERGRVYYGADDLVPVAGQFAFSLFGLGGPSGVGFGQNMGIRHDRAGRCIVGFVIPRHSDDCDLLAGDGSDG